MQNLKSFLHFESDEWGGMEFLQSPNIRLVCSDLSSKLNLTGWYNVPVNHISFWDNEALKTGTKSPIYHDSSCSSLGHHDDIRRNNKIIIYVGSIHPTWR